MVTFNDKKETDIPGLFLKDRKILAPTKQKIKVNVPFMNSAYDMSTVGSGGEIVYSQRPIECKFGIKASSKTELQVRYEQFLAWIYDVGQSKLIFDDLANVYFLAEVEKEPTWQETYLYGESTVTFVAEPFKYGIDLEGNKLWDTFSFEFDYLQDTEFDVSGSKTVTIYNPGRTIVPNINVSSFMTATIGNYTSNLSIGDNTDYLFKLKNGANIIEINGTGHIKFVFRKEVL
ncbi:MAG: phage tail family protein [Bacillota bacterium]|nr:phage tail family protein [Bacillota bacterium]